TALEAQVFLLASISVERRALDPRTSCRRFDDHGARSVAEDHARRAIGPVDEARDRLGADERDLAHRPRRHEASRDGEPVDKAGARRAEVEDRSLSRAEAFLHETGGGG